MGQALLIYGKEMMGGKYAVAIRSIVSISSGVWDGLVSRCRQASLREKTALMLSVYIDEV